MALSFHYQKHTVYIGFNNHEEAIKAEMFGRLLMEQLGFDETFILEQDTKTKWSIAFSDFNIIEELKESVRYIKAKLKENPELGKFTAEDIRRGTSNAEYADMKLTYKVEEQPATSEDKQLTQEEITEHYAKEEQALNELVANAQKDAELGNTKSVDEVLENLDKDQPSDRGNYVSDKMAHYKAMTSTCRSLKPTNRLTLVRTYLGFTINDVIETCYQRHCVSPRGLFVEYLDESLGLQVKAIHSATHSEFAIQYLDRRDFPNGNFIINGVVHDNGKVSFE